MPRTVEGEREKGIPARQPQQLPARSFNIRPEFTILGAGFCRDMLCLHTERRGLLKEGFRWDAGVLAKMSCAGEAHRARLTRAKDDRQHSPRSVCKRGSEGPLFFHVSVSLSAQFRGFDRPQFGNPNWLPDQAFAVASRMPYGLTPKKDVLLWPSDTCR